MGGTRNVISGNVGDGVQIFAASSTGNQVIGNLIGTNAAGTASAGGTTEHGCLGDYSNHGPGLDIVAPGGGGEGSEVPVTPQRVKVPLPA